MKNLTFLLIPLLFGIISCKKNDTSVATANYSSLAQLRSHEGYAPTTYNVDGSAGGSFTTSRGTKVIIPANAFVTQMNTPVTGQVQVQFMDLYSKTDLVMGGLSCTGGAYGSLMKSDGEFFIKATQYSQGIQISSLGSITVIQPVTDGNVIDTGMQAFVGNPGLVGATGGLWQTPTQPQDTFHADVGELLQSDSIIFSLYRFNSPVDSGTWCNSDNPSYFSGYTTATVWLNNTTDTTVETDLFLVFTGTNSMVHVYGGPKQFIYVWAPVGLQATAVAMGISRSGILMASFRPITITSFQIDSFQMQAITDADLMAKLKMLN